MRTKVDQMVMGDNLLGESYYSNGHECKDKIIERYECLRKNLFEIKVQK